MRMSLTLVTGPVRSGKSRYVVERAVASGRPVRYVATALRDPADREWNERLRRHERDRPAHWNVVESAGLDSQDVVALFESADEGECIIVDALGTWLAARIARSHEMFGDRYVDFERMLDQEASQLADAMLGSRAQIIVVAEEVGWDVVPVEPSARLFRDVLGRMKQRLAGRASEAYLVVCGFVLDLRELGGGGSGRG
jgi:adenosylcobinamide kinase/adenosylcobinamide-phosphate guanylyltransferase